MYIIIILVLQHEQGSVKMLDSLLQFLDNLLKTYGLTDTDITFIKELIKPQKTVEKDEDSDTLKELPWPHKGRPEDKSFLYEVITFTCIIIYMHVCTFLYLFSMVCIHFHSDCVK